MTNFMLHGIPLIWVNSGQDAKSRHTDQLSVLPSALKKAKSQKPLVLQPFSRAIRDVSSLVLSWRDGMTESEREDKRRIEERMQILAARMQNVRPCSMFSLIGTALTNRNPYGRPQR